MFRLVNLAGLAGGETRQAISVQGYLAGRVAEWLKAPDSKSGVGVTPPEVRILSLPPVRTSEPEVYFNKLNLQDFIHMPTEIFQASRWTRGNLLFPTYIAVSEKSVSRRKRSWFRMDEMSISISKVASVHIKTGLIWSEILIESSGGSDPVASHGHKKADAQRIKELIENAQAEFARKPQGTE